MSQAVYQMAPIHWQLDVHQHAHELAERFKQGVMQIVPKRQRFHRKTYYQEDTKVAVIEKAAWRKAVLHCQARRKRHELRACFYGWKINFRGPADWEWLEPYEKQLARDWSIAFTSFRRARNLATTLARRDTNDFFEDLRQKWKEADLDQDSKTLWQKVKHFLPKAQQRKAMRSAQQQESMRGDL